MANDAFEGRVHWSGEHWINYIRRPGETTDSGNFSLYHTRCSQAGEGTVAFVLIPEAGIDAIYADNLELAGWIYENMIRGRGNQFDHEMPVVKASMSRGGDIRTSPSWIIAAAAHTIESTWTVSEPATIYWGPAPSGQENIHIFSLLYFTTDTALTLDGRPIAGEAYTRDIWHSSIGGDRSSCVFALAETLMIVE